MVMPQTTQTAAILSMSAVSYIQLAHESCGYLRNNYIPAAMITFCWTNNVAQLYQTNFFLGYPAGHSTTRKCEGEGKLHSTEDFLFMDSQVGGKVQVAHDDKSITCLPATN